jgi:hypothetical protein
MFKIIFSFLFKPFSTAGELLTKDSSFKNKIFFFIQLFLVIIVFGFSFFWFGGFWLWVVIWLLWWWNAIIWILIWGIIAMIGLIIVGWIISGILLLIWKIFKGTAKFADVLAIVAMSQIPSLFWNIVTWIITNVNIMLTFTHSWIFSIINFIFMVWTIFVFSQWFAKIEWFSRIVTGVVFWILWLLWFFLL